VVDILKSLICVIDLRFTKDTELGENDSIKNPPPMPSSRRARKLEKGEQRFISLSISAQWITKLTSSIEPVAQHNARNFSALKRAHRERKIPELREADLEESFVRGA